VTVDAPLREEPTPQARERGQALTGRAAAIARNMAASRAMPTATSALVIPTKLLEVNRTILNNRPSETRGGRVSFTHLIGYAMVKALGAFPSMNSSRLFGKSVLLDGLIGW
jgi:2-oxoglutarate decarboxylase